MAKNHFPTPITIRSQGWKSSHQQEKGGKRGRILDYTEGGPGLGTRWRCTIALPPGKAADYIKYTETMLQKCVAPLNSYRKATGRLRRGKYVITGMFTPINMAMKGNPKFVGIVKSSATRAAFNDLIVLVNQVAQRPTHVREICSISIDYGGYCTACRIGIGGVFFPLDSHAEYRVFRLQLPTDIQKRSHAGIIMMGDLELAAALLLTMMLDHAGLSLKHKTIAAWSNNTPTLGWVWRMTTKQCKIAGRLIRGLGLRQRMNETCPLAAHHIPGEKNKGWILHHARIPPHCTYARTHTSLLISLTCSPSLRISLGRLPSLRKRLPP
jgi:hypothetical protein